MSVARILDEKGHKVYTVAMDATVLEAARLLELHAIGALVVVNERGDVVGLLSERDIVAAVAERGCAAVDDLVDAHMRREPQTVTEQESVCAAMETMTNRRCRHLPVVSGGRLIGLISIGDLVKHRIEAVEQEQQSLIAYIATA